MKKVLALAISVGLCATALAERHLADNPTKIGGPVHTKTLSGHEGGVAGTPVNVYSFTAGNYYFYYGATSGNGYNWHLEDQVLRDLAAGNPYGAWLQDITFGISQVEAGPSAFDVLSFWYDTIDYDGSPAGEPVNQDGIMGIWWAGITLGPNPFFPGATLWGLTGNVSTFPGGGVPVTNQAFMYEQAHFTPGLVALHLGIMQGWSSSGTIGSSGDYFFADHLSGSDMDGTYETTEAYYFGGPPFAANFFMAYTACLPCDTNCDGSINPFDINGFLAVVGGGAGCSACSGDANVDGSINPFDINAFLDCLGA